MEYINRDNEIVSKEDELNEILTEVYASKCGRKLIQFLTKKPVSELAGRLMNSRFSKILIKPFIKSNKINMDEYESRSFNSYNDFFTRKIKEGYRKFPKNEEDLGATSDGKLTIYEIDSTTTLKIKNTTYTVENLIRNKRLARRYKGGLVLVYRLSVDNYHRYSYVDRAIKSRNFYIPGRYYSVDPAVLEKVAVFKQNSREYTLMKTQNFGTILHMEVGATCVGKIKNHHEQARVERGQEKGYFEFGGSTIVQIFEKDKIEVLPRYKGRPLECEVHMGDVVAKKKS